MIKTQTLLIALIFTFFSGVSLGQERAPLKTFQFEISLNKLKTNEQAASIRSEVKNLTGVKSCELELIEYELIFTCTNHDLNDYQIMDRVKAVVIENGADIVKINRTEL